MERKKQKKFLKNNLYPKKTKHGAGFMPGKYTIVAEKLEEISKNPSILGEISKNYEKHQFKSGADELSGILIDMIESSKGDKINEK